jgi:hypothetical protein
MARGAPMRDAQRLCSASASTADASSRARAARVSVARACRRVPHAEGADALRGGAQRPSGRGWNGAGGGRAATTAQAGRSMIAVSMPRTRELLFAGLPCGVLPRTAKRSPQIGRAEVRALLGTLTGVSRSITGTPTSLVA